MEISHIQGPRDKVVLDSDKGFPIKIPPMLLLSSTKKVCLTLCFKERGKQATTSGAGSNAPKQNRFYALQTLGEQEGSPGVVTGVLKVFQLDVYVLLDPSATLYFVTPYVAMRFDVLPDVLLEPFSISTFVGDYIVAKRVQALSIQITLSSILTPTLASLVNTFTNIIKDKVGETSTIRNEEGLEVDDRDMERNTTTNGEDEGEKTNEDDVNLLKMISEEQLLKNLDRNSWWKHVLHYSRIDDISKN
ncbi:hypothetical protein MTR67_051868 [Solanum verrucosum]|uniref:Uncharacterized protein n=1 Tax=Solanum verrucosum TaxID=315347 RepID=A0AAF0V891_SOLVR|nr:hypothetical protein MTR67_051868 [Solanum verrucosum]